MNRTFWKTLVLACLALQLGACAQLKLSDPKSSLDNTQKLRSAGIAPANVGSFTLDPRQPADMDKVMNMRGSNSVESPVGGSFSQHLKALLAAELEAAGLLDGASKTVISGMLTDNQLDVGMAEGTGQLAARFTVMRGTEKRYERELRATAKWESSFAAAIAVPAAANGYDSLYRKLVTQLLEDPDFIRAMKP